MPRRASRRLTGRRFSGLATRTSTISWQRSTPGHRLIGLQISTDEQALELGAMNVVSGQDVRVFSTASEVTVTPGALTWLQRHATLSGTVSTSTSTGCWLDRCF